jgi:hypothetical protein
MTRGGGCIVVVREAAPLMVVMVEFVDMAGSGRQ